MTIALKRIYEPPAKTDGTRILVERLWPRGVAKAKAKVDVWMREVAPSTELRQWFDHDPERWAEFRKRYFRELDDHAAEIDELIEHVAAGPVTFVFASREERYNNAVALKTYVERRT